MDLKYTDPKKSARIDERISMLRSKEEEDLAKLLAERYDIKYIDLTGISIDTNALRLIPEENARACHLAAFHMVNKTLSIAIQSPTREDTQNTIKELESRGYSTVLYMTSVKSLERAWSRYKDISFAAYARAGSLDISSNDIEKTASEITNISSARKMIEEVLKMGRAFRISRIVEIVVASAIAVGASDIHVEPEDEGVNLRFRLDGILQLVVRFDKETFLLLLSRIKLLSGMKLNIKNTSQDGRFSVLVSDREIEIRSSVLPGNNGESIVMRLLDPESIKTPMKELGASDKLLKMFLEEIDKPNGMVLNTGPTGSGKTTTLYAFLNKVKNPEIKIITIEDPIEYHLSGIVQTQVDKKRDYDFASGLRSSLRQDPDVIMVGEIRDLETAETAIHAALTGHLVFSTLHTNTAAGAYPRLIDLGVNPKILTSAINLVIAQRLVRRLCPNCRVEKKLEGEDLALLKNIYDSVPDPDKLPFKETIYDAGKCEKCNNTGYTGRIGIFEAIKNSPALEEVVQNNPSEHEIKKIAAQDGILDMAQDGVIKILNGTTTINEVRRVVDLKRREGKENIEDPIETIV